jgi:hypothetical protein
MHNEQDTLALKDPQVRWLSLKLKWPYVWGSRKTTTEHLPYPDEDHESLWAATHFAVFVVHNKMKLKLALLTANRDRVELNLSGIGHNLSDS